MYNFEMRKFTIILLRRFALYTFITISLFLQSCASPREEWDISELAQLRVVITPFLSYAPFFIAQEEGYFAEQGLEVQFVKMTSSGQAIPALVRGEVDVVPGALRINLLNTIARGGRIRFVAAGCHTASGGCVWHAIMARRALVEAGELDHPARLKDRRIAINPASFNGYLVEKLLYTVDLTLSDVKTLDIPTPAEPEALKKGTIDLITTSEPWITRILQAGHGIVWMPSQQVIPDFQLVIVAYGPTLLEENPDAGRRFMVAYLKAVQQYNRGKTKRNLEILAKHTGLDQELLMQACWPAFRDDGQINVQSVLDFQAWAVKKGLLDSPVPKEQFWDPSFIEHACQVLDLPTQ